VTTRLAATLFALGASVVANSQTLPFSFDATQLSGSWAENYNDDFACGADKRKSAMVISADGKRLDIQFDRKTDTAIGNELDHVGASILRATKRKLVIRYDGETRKNANGEPVEWELAIVAPGVYRWRDAASAIGKVNIVVGIRCSQ
jgi:hypothetical protein